MHDKGNHKQDKKTTHRMGENICKWSNGQRINLQNIQTAHGAQYQKNEQTIQLKKWVSQKPKQTSLQGRHTDDEKAHEKMLNIINY